MDALKNNSILIVDDAVKESVISEFRKTSELVDVKFISFSEFKKLYYFDYDKKTIFYLIKKYHYKYEVCLVYLKNLYYIEDKEYKSEKLKFLRDLKRELDEHDLLIYDEYFKSSLSKKNIYVYSKKKISKFYKSVFDKLDVTYLNNEVVNKKVFNIYECKDMESEVNFVCNKIVDLIKSGTDINNIKLLNVKEEYMYLIRKLFGFYNIPLEKKKTTSLYSTRIGKYFLSTLDSSKESIVENLTNEFKNNTEEVNLIINIINDYTWVEDLTSVKEMLIHDLKNTYIKVEQLKNKVSFINLGEVVNSKDYAFLMSFNEGDIPQTFKDEEYISDNIKSEVNIETTLEKNINSKKEVLDFLNSIDNLIISYKLEEGSISYNISSLSDEMNYNVLKFEDEYNNSNIYNKIRLSNLLDLYSKYGVVTKETSKLLSNYPDINYLSYNNKFKGIDKSKLDENILLSYSTLDNYYRCSFRYYIDSVLKLGIFEETFMTFIGSLYHYILSIMDKENFDLDKEYDNFIKESNKVFSKKEEFFLEKLKSELSFVIKTIKEQYKYSSLDNKLYEEKIYINKHDNKTFMGIVDKIMYKTINDKTVVSIVDYKTGNPMISLDNVTYGIGMQLPIYLYLVSKSNKFKNVIIGGFYLQKVLNTVVNKDNSSSYETLKKNNLKLQGYSTNNEEVLDLVDKSYNDSLVIKGLRTSSKGFYSYSKVINESEINKLVSEVDDRIEDAFNGVSEGKFDINPKRIGKINKGCEFCKYYDICYRKENDIVNLKEVKFGGEEE